MFCLDILCIWMVCGADKLNITTLKYPLNSECSIILYTIIITIKASFHLLFLNKLQTAVTRLMSRTLINKVDQWPYELLPFPGQRVSAAGKSKQKAGVCLSLWCTWVTDHLRERPFLFCWLPVCLFPFFQCLCGVYCTKNREIEPPFHILASFARLPQYWGVLKLWYGFCLWEAGDVSLRSKQQRPDDLCGV